MNTLVAHFKTRTDRNDDQHRLRSITSQHVPRATAVGDSGGEEYDHHYAAEEQTLRNEAYLAFRDLLRYFPDAPAQLPPPLPKPVFIPQRRQGDRLRGFQLLYSEELARSGVTEQEFISFLNRLNIAIGFDNKIKIFNFAIDVATVAVSSWEVAVATIATQAITTTAAHIKSRAKSEAYVATANERYFHPRGLHAHIVPVGSVVPSSTNVSYGSSGSTTQQDDSHANQQSTFQFSLGSTNVLPEHHVKAKGGLFNFNKRPIEYDPFDYGPGYVRLRPDQYCPLRPSQYQEPATKLLEKVAARVEKYNVWQDRLPARKNARKEKKRQETLKEIRRHEGEAGVLRFLRQEEEKHRKALTKEKSRFQRFQDRNKIILIIANLDASTREYMASTLAGA